LAGGSDRRIRSCLDAQRRLLTRSGEVVPLEPKVIDTLVVLVEADGRLVTKQDLMERVWPGTFVEEGSLARNVSAMAGGTLFETSIVVTGPRGWSVCAGGNRKTSVTCAVVGPGLN